MLDIILICLGFLLMIIGLIGCFVYKIPGPILAFLGILILQFGTDIKPFTTTALIVCAILVILCKVLEKLAPKLISKLQTFGKGGKRGAMYGSLLGIILVILTGANSDSTGLIITMMIVGLLVLPFLLSLLGEFIANKNFSLALKSGSAAFANYLVNSLLQLAVCVYCIYTAFSNIQ